jgi:hypothetical protein
LAIRVSTADARPSRISLISWHTPKSVLEMLVITATLVKHFEFSLPAEDEKTGTGLRICRKPSVIMTPMVEGQIGAWMGLAIKPID